MPGIFVGLHERGRAQHAIAEQSAQARAVGIDRPEALDRNGRSIDIFPAAVEDPPIFHDRRSEVVEIVGRQSLHMAAVTIAAVEDRCGRCPAIGEGGFPVGKKGNRIVGQPAGIEVVRVVIGQLCQIRSIDIDGVELQLVLDRLLPTEQDGLAVVRNVGIEYQSIAGVNQSGQLRFGRADVNHVESATRPLPFDVIGVDVCRIDRVTFDNDQFREPELSRRQLLAKLCALGERSIRQSPVPACG